MYCFYHNLPCYLNKIIIIVQQFVALLLLILDSNLNSCSIPQTSSLLHFEELKTEFNVIENVERIESWIMSCLITSYLVALFVWTTRWDVFSVH